MDIHARPYRDPTDLVRMRRLLVAGRQATSFLIFNLRLCLATVSGGQQP